MQQLRSVADRASPADEQAALRRVATLVARGAAPNEVFDAVAVEAGRLIGADLAVLSRFDQRGGVTVLASRTDGSAREPPVTDLSTIDPESLTAEVLRTGSPARVDDFARASGPWAAQTRELGHRSAVGTPVTVEGRLWGVMFVVSNDAYHWPPDTEDRLAAFTELLATAIANRDAREKVARLLDEQAALRRVATLVARGVSQSEVLDAVAKEVNKLLDAGTTTVLRYEGTEAITVVASYGDFAHEPPIGTLVPLDGESVSAKVLRTGRPARVESYEEATGTIAALARELGVRSAVGAPIAVEGHLWVVTIGFCDPEPPLDVEHRLAAFTELAAAAIGNAESRAELAASEAHARELAAEQAALRRVATLVVRAPASEQFFSTVAREVGSVLNVPGVLVARFEADGTVDTVGAAYASDLSGAGSFLGVGTRMPPDPGSLAAQVFQTHSAARVDDYSTLPGRIGAAARAAGLGSGVGSPIVVNGDLWGQLAVFSRTGTVLPVGLENRLHDFIELVATAIANYEARADLAASEARARELAEEQAALRRVATLVAQGTTPDELFSAVAEEVAGLIGIPVVGVYRYETDKTFTTLGLAGDRKLAVGSRWPVVEDGLAGMILATGRPARKDDYPTMPGPLGAALREEQIASAAGVPIMVDGNIWGFMAATCRPGESIPADTEQHLERFTELVATGVSNATVRADLIASRARVVAAADETRRRLERDLHDGFQQWLVALALKARKTARLSAADESAVQELFRLADDLVAVTDELRELSHGIHPAILSEAGLDEALKALARRSAIRVDLDIGFQGRFDPTLEATVYYVTAESITNAVKHARASMVAVRGGLRDGVIDFEIRDDGIGGADPRRGTGLIGLEDRVDTLGGTISFASPAGAGTTIRVKLPAGPRAAEDPALPRPDVAASPPASG